ncbi:MAG: Ig-like domain-containing protein [Planctomycetota bacterium]
MTNRTLPSITGALLAVGLASLLGCSGGTPGDRANRGDFKVTLISTGSGQIFPYRIRRVDSFKNPTDTIVNVDDETVLHDNVTSSNGLLPIAAFGDTATLPNGAPGNHFFLMRFSHKLEVNSILSDDIANSANSGLTTAVSLLAYNPVTEQTSVLVGRGFVGGYTYFNRGGVLQLVQAVRKNGSSVEILDPEATGFPRGFSGDTDLVEPNSFVFVADSVATPGLASFDKFPGNVLLRTDVRNAVRDSEGHVLEQEVCTATTVGADPNSPDVLGFSGQRLLELTPNNGETNVDPSASIVVRFNKPVQPGDIGTFFSQQNLTPATRGVSISVTAGPNQFPMLYYADPFSVGDMCNYRVRPAWQFPGGSEFLITVAVQREQVHGVADVTKTLSTSVSSAFRTSQGTGIVNAPVAPEAVYVGVGGASPGVAVIDLNGFGQGTGDPAISRWALNPNIGQQDIDPPLSAPANRSSTTGGGAGVLTLTQDTLGNTLLLDESVVGSVSDIHIGCPLDLVFNDEARNRYATKANQANPFTRVQASGNNISTPPHPNPPRLDLGNPPAPERGIFGERPTRTSSSGSASGGIIVTVPPCQISPLNLLVRGNPFANERSQVGIFGNALEGTFNGPQPIPPSPPVATPYCPFHQRQQIGHFLYVLDRDNRQVLVVNSNRFTILDRIRLTDPVDMAMSPNLRRLAVTNFSSSSVSIIDINPLSPTFHTVIAESRVARGPTRVAWQPDGEDILVVSPPSNSVTILGSVDFAARRTIAGFLNDPIDVSVSERYQTTGNLSQIYYAYILNANGSIAIYESGPDGVNGIGFNDVVGIVQGASFRRAGKIINDHTVPLSAVMVAHVDESGVGQISRLELTSSPQGVSPIQQNQGGFLLPPTFRQKEWTVTQRIGGLSATTPRRDQLSGNAPVDIAFDDMINYGAAADQVTPYNTKVQLPPMNHSGKGTVKTVGAALQRPTLPKLIFVALQDVGRVDVFEIDSGQRVASIQVPGARTVTTYWRQ